MAESETPKASHSGIYPRTAAASIICACGVTVPQAVCNELEAELQQQSQKIAELEQERDALRINLNHVNTEVVTLRNLLASRNAELEVARRDKNE